MSKGYSFSLQKVLDYRKRIEGKRAVELSKEHLNLKNIMNEYTLLEEKKEQVLDQKKNNKMNAEKIDLNSLKVRKDYIVQLNNELSTQVHKVNEANLKVNETRKKLMQASKDKKMLEKLNSRKYEEYKKEVKLEQSNNDNEVAGRIDLLNKKKVTK